jgi:MFS family permease
VKALQLGLRANWRQFALLVLINAFVGGMVGLERSVLPLLAEREFGLASKTAILSFLVSFGIVKAIFNALAGYWADRWGRKKVLVAGWLLGFPVPWLILYAPYWHWVVAANLLLGAQQGLCWSVTVIAKIDLAGPAQRGLAMGLNEFAGYGAVALAAYSASALASSFGLRFAPFLLGVAFATVGLMLSLCCVQETLPFTQLEARSQGDHAPRQNWRKIFALVSWQDRRLFGISQAGLVNNLNDGMVWGLLPLWLAAHEANYAAIGLVTGAYPLVWGIGQIATGGMSDRIGRTPFIVGGMVLQAFALVGFVAGKSFALWLAASVALGIGTAMVYPTLLAAISDLTPPSWRASAVGVYRFWRDLGYAVGALLAGGLADSFSIPFAFVAIALLTFFSGVLAGVTLRPTEAPITA